MRDLKRATALAVATVAVVATVGGATAQTDAGKLVIWGDDLMLAGLKGATDLYTEQTGIEVDLQVQDFTKLDDLLRAAIPAGTGPDGFITGGIGTKRKDGLIAPVELGDRASLINPVPLSVYTQDGKIWAVPVATENIALLRNVDLAPTAPATWEEAIAMGRQAVADGAAEIPFLAQTAKDSGDWYHMLPLQTSMCDTVWTFGPTGAWDPSSVDNFTSGDENGFAFAEWLATWTQEGIFNPDMTSDVAIDRFITGKSPFYITGPWFLPTIKESGINYAIDPIPTTGACPARPYQGAIGVYQSSSAANPLAMADLLNFLTTEEAAIAIYESGGKPPAHTTALEAVASDKDVQGWALAGKDGIPDCQSSVCFGPLGKLGAAEYQIMENPDAWNATWTEAVAAGKAKIAEDLAAQ